MEQTQNTCKVAIKFRFTVKPNNEHECINWGKLKIVTEIKPTILFYKLDNYEKSNLIEQIAINKVKELIKTSRSNTLDVEIISVALL